MPEPLQVWIGKDEVEGVPSQPRKDLKPPPHWRLEAVAATHMPRTLMVSPDRRRAVFIEDRDTSVVRRSGTVSPSRSSSQTSDVSRSWMKTAVRPSAPTLSERGRSVAATASSRQ